VSVSPLVAVDPQNEIAIGLCQNASFPHSHCYLKSVDVKASYCHAWTVSSAPSKAKSRKVLAANLRAHRNRLGLSQEALADRAGLHRTYVGSIERSERNVSIDNIDKLAGALGVSPARLLTPAVKGGD